MFSTRIRAAVRHQWAGLIALFLVLTGGSAYALDGSNTVFSDDIVDGEVKTPDIANAAVVTDKLAQAAVTSGKVKNDNLVGGDVADESLTGLDVADNSLKGADVDESTLDQVLSAVLGGKGRSAGGNGSACDPDSSAFVDCGFVRLDIPAQNRAAGTRVLVIGAIRGVVEFGDDDRGGGFCQLGFSPPDVPGTTLVQSETIFNTSDDDPGDFSQNGTMIAVTPPIGPGTFDFGIQCEESDGRVRFVRAKIAAVALSPN
jgi:hypothetical protein